MPEAGSFKIIKKKKVKGKGKMYFLGISDFQYNSGVTLMDADKVLFSINEERLSRKKSAGGFPFLSLAETCRFMGGDFYSDVAHIYASSIMNPPIFVRYFDFLRKLENGVRDDTTASLMRILSDFMHFNTALTTSPPKGLYGGLTKLLSPAAIRRKLPKTAREIPLSFIEHHLAHAAAAFYTSGFSEALCITADEMGDGISLTVNKCSGKEINRLWSYDDKSSYGYFYKLITEVLGFVPMRHEGKVMALAAQGDHKKVKQSFPFESLSGGEIIYTGGYGIKEVNRLKKTLLYGYDKEDMAAWLQYNCQEHFKVLAKKWLSFSGAENLVLSGGFFSNVKVNQALSELEEVRNIFVYPNMGDGGISHGAILAARKPAPSGITNIYWGNDYSEGEILSALVKSGLVYRSCRDIEIEIAKLLVNKKTVARFKGRMEWGPRALGNRSIFYHTKDKSVNSWLNKKLGRSEFMPFAPATLIDDAPELYLNSEKAILCAEFMTISLFCTQKMKQDNPAAIHSDGTARPQLVRKSANPEFYKILVEYKKSTNSGCILNTSFNIHDEPIVCTPFDALKAFKKAGLDYLAIGNFLVEGETSNG